MHFVLETGPWSEIFYIITLTANIGYFTNFIAIKMLFKPYYKTVFGRQGLIPKNQPRMAEAAVPRGRVEPWVRARAPSRPSPCAKQHVSAPGQS